MMHNYSPASDRNKAPILEALSGYLKDTSNVLEIASGSGQHAFHFVAQCPHLNWQLTELGSRCDALELNRQQFAPQLPPAATLDVCDDPWPFNGVELVYTANTLHIISEAEVACLLRGAGKCLVNGGLLCVYGPFRYGGVYTSESNARFDAMLRAENSHRGIRDFEAVNRIAADHGLVCEQDRAMPANNQLITWRRHPSERAHA